MDANSIRRRDNGTIDIDFYRQQAVALHRQAWSNALRKLGGAIHPEVAAIIFFLGTATLPVGRQMPPL